MEPQTLVQQRVHEYYWRDDANCATTTLKILSERFGVGVCDQVMDAALGMHGAGGYRAQCGLVEGALMFLGIAGRARGVPEERIVDACKEFAQQFEGRFGSLLCAVLRPEGFRPDLPPHICEGLTCEAITMSAEFVADFLRPASGL